MAAAPPRRGDLISDLASEITAAQRRGEFEGRVRRHALLAYDDWSQDMLKQLAGDD